MKNIQKIQAGDLIEQISKNTSFVSPVNGWIVINEDGSFFNHPPMGYLINKSKSICQEYANAENN